MIGRLLVPVVDNRFDDGLARRTSGLVQKRKKPVQAVSSVSKVSSNPTKCVASVYLLQIARENDPCKSGRKLVAYAIGFHFYLCDYSVHGQIWKNSSSKLNDGLNS